ncbi:hypothetical protein QUF73_02460 [Cytobacillus sp. NJ13]|nr:hypothetical protein [Cytobacillus sp. NJ13]
MDWLLSLFDVTLTLIYLFLIGQMRKLIKTKYSSPSLILKKLLIALPILIVSSGMVLFLPNSLFFIFNAVLMGGIIYSVLLVIISLLLPLFKGNGEKDNKLASWMEKF